MIHAEEFGLSIDRDGVWRHHGAPIARAALVKLFASVLRREADGSYWLVTPYERGPIAVADAPFVAVAVERLGSGREQVLRFVTNLDEAVEAGPGHDIHVTTDAASGGPRPYIEVRPGLPARILRSVYYELAELAELGPDGREEIAGVWSKGRFYPLEAPVAAPSATTDAPSPG